MTDRIAISAPERIREGTALPVVLVFLDSTGTLQAPTTASYRVVDPDSCEELVGSTDIAPATAAVLTIPASASKCDGRWPIQRRQLIVQVDLGLAGQVTEVFGYEVEALRQAC